MIMSTDTKFRRPSNVHPHLVLRSYGKDRESHPVPALLTGDILIPASLPEHRLQGILLRDLQLSCNRYMGRGRL